MGEEQDYGRGWERPKIPAVGLEATAGVSHDATASPSEQMRTVEVAMPSHKAQGHLLMHHVQDEVGENFIPWTERQQWQGGEKC